MRISGISTVQANVAYCGRGDMQTRHLHGSRFGIGWERKPEPEFDPQNPQAYFKKKKMKPIVPAGWGVIGSVGMIFSPLPVVRHCKKAAASLEAFIPRPLQAAILKGQDVSELTFGFQMPQGAIVFKADYYAGAKILRIRMNPIDQEKGTLFFQVQPMQGRIVPIKALADKDAEGLFGAVFKFTGKGYLLPYVSDVPLKITPGTIPFTNEVTPERLRQYHYLSSLLDPTQVLPPGYEPVFDKLRAVLRDYPKEVLDFLIAQGVRVRIDARNRDDDMRSILSWKRIYRIDEMVRQHAVDSQNRFATVSVMPYQSENVNPMAYPMHKTLGQMLYHILVQELPTEQRKAFEARFMAAFVSDMNDPEVRQTPVFDEIVKVLDLKTFKTSEVSPAPMIFGEVFAAMMQQRQGGLAQVTHPALLKLFDTPRMVRQMMDMLSRDNMKCSYLAKAVLGWEPLRPRESHQVKGDTVYQETSLRDLLKAPSHPRNEDGLGSN